mmetsp:Transcript_8470/g.23541  ORF Transcript_8470/g.23541 Transcript_8470/m.23541 type:complete len:520 (-) Transcript_8470:579-2138(-)
MACLCGRSSARVSSKAPGASRAKAGEPATVKPEWAKEAATEASAQATAPEPATVDPEAAEEAAAEAYARTMQEQFQKAISNHEMLENTALSKRSAFKFARTNTKGLVDTNLGSTAVARPDLTTPFGERFAEAIDSIQDLAWEVLGKPNCRRQTTPHMSIGAVLLDRATPGEFNSSVQARAGQLANVKRYIDSLDPPPRARIQTLKINPDGCLTFQLEHDESQDVTLTEEELKAALMKIPTCSSEQALAAELKKFAVHGEGLRKVSRFQQIRLALGAEACEIKGLYPSGHMVLANLVNAEDLAKIPEETLLRFWRRCHGIWAPLASEWFELGHIVVLVYVERSLNEGSVVSVPAPGAPLRAYPEDNEAAQGLLQGVFELQENSDILINEAIYEERKQHAARAMWLSYRAEVREMAANEAHVKDFHKLHRRNSEVLARSMIHALQKFKTDEDAASFIQKRYRERGRAATAPLPQWKNEPPQRAASPGSPEAGVEEVAQPPPRARVHWFWATCCAQPSTQGD